MQIGIVGKPSSGKSSFFKAATMVDVSIAPYPFTTIKPNVGIGYVETDCVCKQYGVKCNPKNSICEDGKRSIPIKLIDVAGLVPNAHLGKGMGNQFLDDLRQADCLIHVVDISGTTDQEGNPTHGHDPAKDVEFLEEEIIMWFYGIIEKALEKYRKKSQFGKTEKLDILTENLSGLQISKEQIKIGLEKVGIENIKEFSKELLRLSKPIIIAANKIDLPESEKNYNKLKDSLNIPVIPTCAAAEIALKTAKEKGIIKYKDNKIEILEKIDEKQRKGLEFISNILEKYGGTGIQKCLNESVFNVLGYIVVYPVADHNKLSDKNGNVLPDAFLVKKGTTMKEFAFMIHTDIGEKFIGGIDAKTKLKLGADSILKNNDVVEILFQKR